MRAYSVGHEAPDIDILACGIVAQIPQTVPECIDVEFGKRGGWGASSYAWEFLKVALAGGPVQSNELAKQAELRNINWKTLERAAARLNVRKYPKEGKWWWELRMTGLWG